MGAALGLKDVSLLSILSVENGLLKLPLVVVEWRPRSSWKTTRAVANALTYEVMALPILYLPDEQPPVEPVANPLH